MSKGIWVASSYPDKDSWETPDDLFQRYDDEHQFVLDAAANESNHKCDIWFGPGSPIDEEDALTAHWLDYTAGPVWLNPPYSRGNQRKFIEKALEYKDDITIVCLLPADTSTKLFHELILPNGSIEFLQGRIKFKGAVGKPKFASMVVVF